MGAVKQLQVPDRPRHIAEFIPQRYTSGEHFELAEQHAKQVKRACGQTRFHHIKNCIRHLLEGLAS